MLSLHVISAPMLSASHLNLRDPELSFYLGEISSKHEPTLVFYALDQLMARYNDVLLKSKSPLKLSEAVMSSSNVFSALEEQYSYTAPPIPLLLNTDGFVRYLGAEIAAGILKRVQPSHVLQLVSEKDRSLEAVDHYLRDAVTCQLLSLEPGRTSASRIAAVDLRSLRWVGLVFNFYQLHVLYKCFDV